MPTDASRSMTQTKTSPSTIQFSLRALMVFMATLSCGLAAIARYGVFGVACVFGIAGLALVSASIRTTSARLGCVGSLFLFPASCLLVGMVLFCVGPIFFAAQWPAPLRQMARIANVNWYQVKAWGLGGDGLDADYVWRMPASPDGLDGIVADFELSEIEPMDVPNHFWNDFPRYWRPTKSDTNRYYDCEGEFIATYDPQRRLLYVWHHHDW
jgi:predicted membrane channel-forming protein YqfA (hemolysin III family)